MTRTCGRSTGTGSTQPAALLSVFSLPEKMLHGNMELFYILLCTTDQHKKYDIFHVEHFSQYSNLILDRSHRDYSALVNKSAVNAGRETKDLTVLLLKD